MYNCLVRCTSDDASQAHQTKKLIILVYIQNGLMDRKEPLICSWWELEHLKIVLCFHSVFKAQFYTKQKMFELGLDYYLHFTQRGHL